MAFYFLTSDNAFHWVRASSLYSSEARRRQVFPRTLFRSDEPGASLPVFNRIDRPDFRKFRSLCSSFGVPYLVDLDDLYWEIPDFSRDPARLDPDYVAFADKLISHAAAVIVSTPELKQQIEARFPDKHAFLVENSPPAWFAPRYGVLVANTDAFKMGSENISWFIDLLRLLFHCGLSIQLIGENQNLQDRCGDFLVHSLPSMDYGSFLQTLAASNARLALVPVEQSHYADCKSPIKAIEFLSQRIPVIASDIAPYRRLSSLHGSERFRVVPNTLEDWKQAAEALISRVPAVEREQGKAINAMLVATRDTQFQQWLAVADSVRDRQADEALMRQVFRKLQYYKTLRDTLGPIRRHVRMLSHRFTRIGKARLG